QAVLVPDELVGGARPPPGVRGGFGVFGKGPRLRRDGLPLRRCQPLPPRPVQPPEVMLAVPSLQRPRRLRHLPFSVPRSLQSPLDSLSPIYRGGCVEGSPRPASRCLLWYPQDR